ncbi:hypothetical protein, partial [Streptomyces buecherae]|uniref:hypothetical protein n=1 Tax=Streptomyces buecherae TaxID=2763006 RepID=UPI0021C48639
WAPAPETLPTPSPGRGKLPVLFPLEINASTVDGPEGPVLGARWSCPAGILDQAELTELADLWVAARPTSRWYASPSARWPPSTSDTQG